MIVVDTSAVVAIFRQEADAAMYALAIADDDAPRISAAGALETSMVLRGLKRLPADQAESWLDEFLQAAGLAVEPVTVDQCSLARQAHAAFGKGGGHPAQLNYGDCFAYALAKALDAPLLFKGDDFGRTDIQSAVGP